MTTFVPSSPPGDMTTFNIHHGFTESLVRGMRNSFLADSDYHHLTQCESLEDVKLNLTESDYSDALADMGSISPNELQKQAIGKVRQYRAIFLSYDNLIPPVVQSIFCNAFSFSNNCSVGLV
jgi:vacuolar-type H+-ATPase subunit C/Vma6